MMPWGGGRSLMSKKECRTMYNTNGQNQFHSILNMNHKRHSDYLLASARPVALSMLVVASGKAHS